MEDNKITTIRVTWETKKALKKQGTMEDTEEEVIKRLLKIDKDKSKIINDKYKKKISDKM